MPSFNIRSDFRFVYFRLVKKTAIRVYSVSDNHCVFIFSCVSLIKLHYIAHSGLSPALLNNPVSVWRYWSN